MDCPTTRLQNPWLQKVARVSSIVKCAALCGLMPQCRAFLWKREVCHLADDIPIKSGECLLYILIDRNIERPTPTSSAVGLQECFPLDKKFCAIPVARDLVEQNCTTVNKSKSLDTVAVDDIIKEIKFSVYRPTANTSRIDLEKCRWVNKNHRRCRFLLNKVKGNCSCLDMFFDFIDMYMNNTCGSHCDSEAKEELPVYFVCLM